MSGWENYIFAILVLLILCLLFYIVRRRTQGKQSNGKQRYIMETFNLAQKQFEELSIKFPEAGGTRAGYSGLLDEVNEKILTVDANGFVPAEIQGKDVDVYFRARREEGPVFYAFNTRVIQVISDYENSHLTLETPDHLRIEKKRHFIRVQPAKEDIRVIGVWEVEPGKQLPHSAANLGTPITHYKSGNGGEIVQMENISGSGLALRFSSDKVEALEKEFPKGSQMLCLVVYVLEELEKPVAFWCTGEVMNSRIKEGPKPELVLGLEFTNWAVLEGSSNEIHWAHSSPTKGARPMLQWVEQTEKRQAGYKK